MAELTKEITVLIDPSVYQALKIMSDESSRSISELVNEALAVAYKEDVEEMKLIAGSDDVTIDNIFDDDDDG
jgi:predicted CopG family antitoxin